MLDGSLSPQLRPCGLTRGAVYSRFAVEHKPTRAVSGPVGTGASASVLPRRHVPASAMRAPAAVEDDDDDWMDDDSIYALGGLEDAARIYGAALDPSEDDDLDEF
ncbi:MAG TPA: hypothetical protein DCP11_06340 [Microbacteriaceae bacterium]|nr:hypothetical protein [Microbacteriaceae bacterium]